jgi:hypothetical protein
MGNGKWKNRFHHEPVTKIGSARNGTRRKYFIGQQQSITVIKSVPHHHDIFFFFISFFFLFFRLDYCSRLSGENNNRPTIDSQPEEKEIKNYKMFLAVFFLGGGGQKMEIKFISK